jgi:hypothetical protein
MADPTAPAEQDLTIYQGQTWSGIFELFTDTANTIRFDATDCEIDMHIREGEYNSGATLKLAASTRATGDGAGRITWLSQASDSSIDEDGSDPSVGIFKVEFAASVTEAVSPTKPPRKGDHETVEFIYDVEVVYPDGVTVIRIMEGVINFNLEVTHRA